MIFVYFLTLNCNALYYSVLLKEVERMGSVIINYNYLIVTALKSVY